jgi:menaquinone-specific isochorismate synthase
VSARTAPAAPAPAEVIEQARGLVARTAPLTTAGLAALLGPGGELGLGGRPDGLLWWRDDLGLAGAGVALRIDLPAGLDASTQKVREALRTIPTRDETADAGGSAGGATRPGRGPVALGALPFDRRQPAALVVPRVLIGWQPGVAWFTTVTPSGETVEADELAEGLSPGEPPEGFRLSSSMSHAAWRSLIEATVRAIGEDQLGKVVLARAVDVSANRPFVIPDVLGRLRALYPTCTVFHAGGFLGASPELLVERRGAVVRSHPLAGTAARSGDIEADRRLVDALLSSSKERGEHRFVIDAITAALGPACEQLEVPDRPAVLPLRNVSHLATHINGRLRPVEGDAGDPPSALDLVAALHPTPAVAGTPRDAALAYLGEVEGLDRGRYAGPVGWMDREGDGSWVLGIRSAEVSGTTARMFAGVGVVRDSDPEAELTETQLKLQALLAALVRP